MIAAAADARRRLGLARPAKPGRLVDRLTRPELEQLLRAAYAQSGARGVLLKTLFLTGCRVAELVALEVDDFDHSGPTITVRQGKGNKSRTVPILPGLADELRVYLGHRARGPLFVSRRLRAFGVRRVEQLVAQLARAAGLVKRVYPHLLRHTVAQHLLEGGMPLEQVQRFLGHSSITTTQIYAESTPAMIRDGYRRALM